MNKLKVLDLFSGIGGFSLGLDQTRGFETAAFCEIDEWCQKILKKHWPLIPIYNDVRNLNYDGSIDLVCGGFPCQPFSHAGQRKGVEDDRHLWPAMLRIVEKQQPTWFIGENVAGLTSMGFKLRRDEVESRSSSRYQDYDFYEAIYSRKEKMLLNSICEDLERIGFEVIPLIIPACGLDAKHIRARVWILGYSEHNGSLAAERRREQQKSQVAERQKPVGEFAGTGGISEDVADTESGRRRKGGDGYCQKWSEGSGYAQSNCGGSYVPNANGARSEARISEQKQWEERIPNIFDDSSHRGDGRQGLYDWSVEPGICRVVDGLPHRVDRIKGLGNAIFPWIAYVIGHYILKAEKEYGS